MEDREMWFLEKSDKCNKYDIIYSIGATCSNSIYLSHAGLRICSGPFDWLTHADLRSRFDLLMNNFEDFFNPLYFEDLNVPKHNEEARYMQNTKTGFWFLHDFYEKDIYEESFLVVRKKYERRITRLWKNINLYNKVAFFWLSHGEYGIVPDDELRVLCSRLCEKIGKKIDFIFIDHDEKIPVGKIKKIQLSDNITSYRLFTHLEGNPTNGNEEIINKIYSQYSLQKSIKNRMYNIFLRLLMCFTPLKKWRKNLKKLRR